MCERIPEGVVRVLCFDLTVCEASWKYSRGTHVMEQGRRGELDISTEASDDKGGASRCVLRGGCDRRGERTIRIKWDWG